MILSEISGDNNASSSSAPKVEFVNRIQAMVKRSPLSAVKRLIPTHTSSKSTIPTNNANLGASGVDIKTKTDVKVKERGPTPNSMGSLGS